MQSLGGLPGKYDFQSRKLIRVRQPTRLLVGAVVPGVHVAGSLPRKLVEREESAGSGVDVGGFDPCGLASVNAFVLGCSSERVRIQGDLDHLDGVPFFGSCRRASRIF